MDVFSCLYIVSFFTLRPSHTFCFSLLLFVKPLVYLLDQLQCVEPSPQMLLQLHGCGLILLLVTSGEGSRVLPSKGRVTSCLPWLCQHIELPSVGVGCVRRGDDQPGWQLRSVGKNLRTFPEPLVCSARSPSLFLLSPALLTPVPFHWQEGFWGINSVLPWCSSLKKQLLEFWSHVMWMNSINYRKQTPYFKPLDLCLHEWTFFSNLGHHFFLVYLEQE